MRASNVTVKERNARRFRTNGSGEVRVEVGGFQSRPDRFKGILVANKRWTTRGGGGKVVEGEGEKGVVGEDGDVDTKEGYVDAEESVGGG
ncbi:uncharacterized protein A4U43_C08F11820 [Asparagus officinalis]|nr:uncharacterized protein A4U43_C08F11820 [Asparagus officinalis]